MAAEQDAHLQNTFSHRYAPFQKCFEKTEQHLQNYLVSRFAIYEHLYIGAADCCLRRQHKLLIGLEIAAVTEQPW